MAEIIMLTAGGLLAGVLGGLLGIGGGIVLMPLLRFLIGLPPPQAAGVCIFAVFFTTLGGSYRHHKLGNVKFRPIAPIIISGAISTAIFSFVFLYLSTKDRWLDLAIGIVFSLVSARMIAEGVPGLVKPKGNNDADKTINGTLLQKISIGSLAGALPGLLGIGTGVILVPTFTYILNAPIKIAMASSLTCFSVNALISSGFKYMQGFVDLKLALPMGVGTLVGANYGAMLNKRFSSHSLKFIFGLVFSYVSLKFILLFFDVKI
jgi:uncharacterized membrane protein YfcA